MCRAGILVAANTSSAVYTESLPKSESMKRISFRQGMLLGFLLIVLLLGGAAVHGWRVVEGLVEESRSLNERALAMSAALQALGERSVDIERSARQSLLLDDPVFRQRFDEHLAESLATVERVEAQAAEPVNALLGGWRMVAEALRSGLDARLQASELAPLLARLGELNQRLGAAGQQWIDAANAALIRELEASRWRLGMQIVLALLGAIIVAIAMAWWLVRPVRDLEQAIIRLGGNRFAEPVKVGGPDDLRQLGHRLDWLRQRLAELEDDRERTLRHVSHELKTPLTALKEGVALLDEEVPAPLAGAQREVVDILAHNVSSLQAQIESLLSLNAAAFEARRLQLSPTPLNRLLQSVVRQRELHIQSRRLKVMVEAPTEQALLDAEKMQAILDNLLSNAIDFSPEHGEIRLSAFREGANWRFECIDQGPGIADADAERIFEPFVQGQRQAPAPRQGSGVGLSIVRELARAMGGSVHLLPSNPGAHFSLEIPDANA